ncbi:MucR family transcriptional regulator [Sphingobium sp.]|uniref:MucR family transcriptional regulator n=1 Tax=Sphingobium sp. TaxID=1912891 RepID=UPI002601E5B3|nr:MucR family transcriptional regulator [Sphingobium sp.]
MAENDLPDYTTLTVQLLSAYVANNSVESSDLAALIQSTRAALIGDIATPEPVPAVVEHAPAVSIRRSLASKEFLLSLIDGKPYKTLKRHLASHGLTPDQYRERYGLPKSYPLVAPAYADMRRAVAQRTGLGQRPAPTPTPVEAEPVKTPKAKAPRKAAAKTGVAAPLDVTPAVETAPAQSAAPAKTQKPKAPRKAKTVASPAAEATIVEAKAKTARKPKAQDTAEPKPVKPPRKTLGISAG